MRQDVQTTPASNAAATANRAGANAEPQAAPFVVPPVDVYEDESGITLLADLPGVAREGLGVRVDGDSLQIEATATDTGPRDMELVHGEARVPAYRRRFTLSRELDSTRISAQLKDGVLRLTIPRAEEAKPRRIEVQVG